MQKNMLSLKFSIFPSVIHRTYKNSQVTNYQNAINYIDIVKLLKSL